MSITAVIAIGVASLIFGLIIAIIRRAIDRKVDSLQRSLNKLENMFAGMGASWFSEFLADLIVGDTRAVFYKSNEIIEALNSEKALFDKIAYPIARWALDYCKRNNSPELEELKRIINQA